MEYGSGSSFFFLVSPILSGAGSTHVPAFYITRSFGSFYLDYMDPISSLQVVHALGTGGAGNIVDPGLYPDPMGLEGSQIWIKKIPDP